jgi:hypothetical protein
MGERLDLGDGHTGEFVQWAPDRELNPQHAHLPDVEKYAMLIFHQNWAGGDCVGMVTFAGDVQSKVDPHHATWDVQSREPLTISPSVLCSCGDHGFIRDGRWVRA